MSGNKKMTFLDGIKKLSELSTQHCLKTKNSKVAYCIYKSRQIPLMFAKREKNLILPVISFPWDIFAEEFTVAALDEIDKNYVNIVYNYLINSSFIYNY
jgi:hypothetical protein